MIQPDMKPGRLWLRDPYDLLDSSKPNEGSKCPEQSEQTTVTTDIKVISPDPSPPPPPPPNSEAEPESKETPGCLASDSADVLENKDDSSEDHSSHLSETRDASDPLRTQSDKVNRTTCDSSTFTNESLEKLTDSPNSDTREGERDAKETESNSLKEENVSDSDVRSTVEVKVTLPTVDSKSTLEIEKANQNLEMTAVGRTENEPLTKKRRILESTDNLETFHAHVIVANEKVKCNVQDATPIIPQCQSFPAATVSESPTVIRQNTEQQSVTVTNEGNQNATNCTLTVGIESKPVSHSVTRTCNESNNISPLSCTVVKEQQQPCMNSYLNVASSSAIVSTVTKYSQSVSTNHVSRDVTSEPPNCSSDSENSALGNILASSAVVKNADENLSKPHSICLSQDICSTRGGESGEGNQGEAQDILAKACLAVGLDEKDLMYMSEVSEDPMQFSSLFQDNNRILYPNTQWNRSENPTPPHPYNHNNGNKTSHVDTERTAAVPLSKHTGYPSYSEYVKAVHNYRGPNQHSPRYPFSCRVPYKPYCNSPAARTYPYPPNMPYGQINYYQNYPYSDPFYYRYRFHQNLQPPQPASLNHHYPLISHKLPAEDQNPTSKETRPWHPLYRYPFSYYSQVNYDKTYPCPNFPAEHSPGSEFYKDYRYDPSFIARYKQYQHGPCFSDNSASSECLGTANSGSVHSKRQPNSIGYPQIRVPYQPPVRTIRPPSVSIQNYTKSTYSPVRSPVSPAGNPTAPANQNQSHHIHSNQQQPSHHEPHSNLNSYQLDNNQFKIPDHSNIQNPHCPSNFSQQLPNSYQPKHHQLISQTQASRIKNSGTQPELSQNPSMTIPQKHTDYYSSTAQGLSHPQQPAVETLALQSAHRQGSYSEEFYQQSQISKRSTTVQNSKNIQDKHLEPTPPKTSNHWLSDQKSISYIGKNGMISEPTHHQSVSNNSYGPYTVEKVRHLRSPYPFGYADWNVPASREMNECCKIEKLLNPNFCLSHSRNMVSPDESNRSPSEVTEQGRRLQELNLNYQNEVSKSNGVNSTENQISDAGCTLQRNGVPTTAVNGCYASETIKSNIYQAFKEPEKMTDVARVNVTSRQPKQISPDFIPSTLGSRENGNSRASIIYSPTSVLQTQKPSLNYTGTAVSTSTSTSSQMSYCTAPNSALSSTSEANQLPSCRYQKSNVDLSAHLAAPSSTHLHSESASGCINSRGSVSLPLLSYRTKSCCLLKSPAEASCFELSQEEHLLSEETPSSHGSSDAHVSQQCQPCIVKVRNSTHRIRPSSEPSREPITEKHTPSLQYSRSSRPLSLPNQISIGPFILNKGYATYSIPETEEEEDYDTTIFKQKLLPIIDHLLSIPEAANLRPFRDNPDELLGHLVQQWRGEGKNSKLEDPYLRMKDNFLLVVTDLFEPSQLSEWGWDKAAPEQILDELLKSSEQGTLVKARLDKKFGRKNEYLEFIDTSSDFLEDDVFLPVSEALPEGSMPEIFECLGMMPSPAKHDSSLCFKDDDLVSEKCNQMQKGDVDLGRGTANIESSHAELLPVEQLTGTSASPVSNLNDVISISVKDVAPELRQRGESFPKGSSNVACTDDYHISSRVVECLQEAEDGRKGTSTESVNAAKVLKRLSSEDQDSDQLIKKQKLPSFKDVEVFPVEERKIISTHPAQPSVNFSPSWNDEEPPLQDYCGRATLLRISEGTTIPCDFDKVKDAVAASSAAPDTNNAEHSSSCVPITDVLQNIPDVSVFKVINSTPEKMKPSTEDLQTEGVKASINSEGTLFSEVKCSRGANPEDNLYLMNEPFCEDRATAASFVVTSNDSTRSTSLTDCQEARDLELADRATSCCSPKEKDSVFDWDELTKHLVQYKATQINKSNGHSDDKIQHSKTGTGDKKQVTSISSNSVDFWNTGLAYKDELAISHACTKVCSKDSLTNFKPNAKVPATFNSDKSRDDKQITLSKQEFQNTISESSGDHNQKEDELKQSRVISRVAAVENEVISKDLVHHKLETLSTTPRKDPNSEGPMISVPQFCQDQQDSFSRQKLPDCEAPGVKSDANSYELESVVTDKQSSNQLFNVITVKQSLNISETNKTSNKASVSYTTNRNDILSKIRCRKTYTSSQGGTLTDYNAIFQKHIETKILSDQNIGEKEFFN